jgi:hypothetical protein
VNASARRRALAAVVRQRGSIAVSELAAEPPDDIADLEAPGFIVQRV